MGFLAGGWAEFGRQAHVIQNFLNVLEEHEKYPYMKTKKKENILGLIDIDLGPQDPTSSS